MAGIELVRDRGRKAPYPWEEKRGWRSATSRSGAGRACCGRWATWWSIMPPLAISLDELDQICLAVEAGIETLATS